MVSKLFLGMSLLGAEWVLYGLIILSVLSITIILERIYFYHKATEGLPEFRLKMRTAISAGHLPIALEISQIRNKNKTQWTPDFESEMTSLLLTHPSESSDILENLAHDIMIRTRLLWEKHQSLLATIGSNTPFIGLFGTVLGIIKAFHDLAEQSTGIQTVSSGISEALVATAIGLFVAIPAVVAFNLNQRRIKCAWIEAEGLKSFLIGQLKIIHRTPSEPLK